MPKKKFKKRKKIIKSKVLKLKPQKKLTDTKKTSVVDAKIEIKTDHNWKFKKRLVRCLRSQGGSSSLNNIMKNHFELRLPLDSYDVRNTLVAEKITGRGFIETLKNFHRM